MVLAALSTLIAASTALNYGAVAPRPRLGATLQAARATGCQMYSIENPIEVGQQIPDADIEFCTEEGGVASIRSVLGGGKSILLGMPGAYTPTCNDVHLPGYYKLAPELKDLGIDTIALVTTNDRFVNAKWQEDMEKCMGIPEGSGPVVMLSDARGDLAESLGLIGYLGRGLGVRSKRFALVIQDGEVKYKAVDEGSIELATTSAEQLVNFLKAGGIAEGPPLGLIAGGSAIVFLLLVFINFIGSLF